MNLQGMGKFLPNWQKESATAGISPELNEAVTAFLNTYGDKDPEERRAAIEEIMQLLPPPEENSQRNRPRRQEQFTNQRQNTNQPGPQQTAPERGSVYV